MIHRVFIACAVCVMSFAIGSANSADYELDLHLHSEEVTPAEFGAGDALLPVVAAAKEIRPADSALDFIGVTSGSSFWLLPKNQNPDVLFLSIGTEELNPADFASSLTWSLVTVTGSGGGAAPGYFSVWNSNSGSPWFSGVVPLMSTAPGASTPGSLTVAAGAHSHFNYGFTEPGLYNITFAASGTLSPALGGGRGGEFLGIGLEKLPAGDVVDGPGEEGRAAGGEIRPPLRGRLRPSTRGEEFRRLCGNSDHGAPPEARPWWPSGEETGASPPA